VHFSDRLGSCWADDIGRGTGRLPDKKDCSAFGEGLRDDGTSCWRDLDVRRVDPYLPADKDKCRARNPCVASADGTRCVTGGCSRIGGFYYPDCGDGWHHTTADFCQKDGSVGIVASLFDRQSCRANEEMQGALCYPLCPDGYNKVGLNICSPPGGPGIKTNLFDRQYCEAGKTMAAGL
jgi:hypothetical protein